VKFLDADAIFKPRDRRLRSQRLADNRIAAEQQLVNRIVAEPGGIVGVGVPTGEPKDPLRQQLGERVPHLRRLPIVDHTPGEAVDQTVPPLGRLEQDGAAIGTRVLLIEGGDEGTIEEIRKENSL
jgi:hypothetical protein